MLGDAVAVAPAPDPADLNWRFFARPDEHTWVRRSVRSVLITVNVAALIVAWSFVSGTCAGVGRDAEAIMGHEGKQENHCNHHSMSF